VDGTIWTTPSDVGTFRWAESDQVSTDATSTSDGEVNTNRLASLNFSAAFENQVATVLAMAATTYPAAIQCANLNAYGYSDWYLPAKDELNVLFLNRTAIGNFDSSGDWPRSYYWSSTESTYLSLSQGVRTSAWGQMFSGGSQEYRNKESTGVSVRCIRKN
jgi:hypothetical protein